MRIADLAKELKVTADFISKELKGLKLRDKEGEITKGVEMILRDELAKKGIGQAVEEEEEKPKAKTVKKVKAPAADDDKKKVVVKKKTASKTKEVESKGKKKTEKIIEAPPVAPMYQQPKQVPPPKPVAPKPPVFKSETIVYKVEKPQPKVEAVKAAPGKVDAAKSPESKATDPKAQDSKAATPIKLEVPVIKKIPPFEAVAKKTRYDQPFVSVKPLNKKRRRDGGDSFNRDTKPSASISSAVTTEPVSEGPLKDIEIPFPISVNGFAVKIQQKINVVLKKLLDMGVFANINQNLSEEVVTKLATAFGFNVIKIKTQEEHLVETHQKEKDDPATLKPRAPVVTFMGHVDHGKTSLLDRIRSSKVADREHGGITQHIGAYSVAIPNGRITFLDTPGHEAFTAMRARGAHITDLAVIVIAADEGIMPQTEEAIDHARAAGVPIVVALNKIDRKNADPDRVKKQLAEHDLLPEDWGGKIGVVGVSAITGEGIDALLERLLLEAEVLELKANPDKKASGIVIEAHLSKGRGAVASMIVQSGTLKEGDMIVAGPYFGKLKALFDDHERPIKEAGPSTPVEILGLSEVPAAGEPFYVVADERHARDIASVRLEKMKNDRMLATAAVSLEDLHAQIAAGHIKELRVVIKSDVQGSLEAIKEALNKIPMEEVKLRIMHVGVGEVNASDVLLAVASQAIIIVFNIGIDTKARQELEKTPVDVREYRIIYDAVEDIRKALEGMLAPKLKRHFLGRIEVRNVFKLSKSGTVAGCYVTKGKVRNKNQVEVLRNGVVAFTGHLSSLKRFKDDVKEVGEGFECGLTVANFNDYQVGDIIEAFDIEQIARRL